VIGLHFAYMIYLIIGGFLAWRWPRTIVLHLAAAGWAAASITFHLNCPLTWAQNQFRDLGGLAPLKSNFIDTYVRGHFYPSHYTTATQAVIGFVVFFSWGGYLVLRHQRATRAAATTGAGKPEAPKVS
jgi:hypothetical protein